MTADSDITKLTEAILAFRDARDWRQFHTPKNVAAAIAIEAAELQEVLLWLTDESVTLGVESGELREKLSDELADVLIYALLFAHVSGIDIKSAVMRKLEKNDKKYPVRLSISNAQKYTEFPSDPR